MNHVISLDHHRITTHRDRFTELCSHVTGTTLLNVGGGDPWGSDSRGDDFREVPSCCEAPAAYAHLVATDKPCGCRPGCGHRRVHFTGKCAAHVGEAGDLPTAEDVMHGWPVWRRGGFEGYDDVWAALMLAYPNPVAVADRDDSQAAESR